MNLKRDNRTHVETSTMALILASIKVRSVTWKRWEQIKSLLKEVKTDIISLGECGILGKGIIDALRKGADGHHLDG